MLTSEAKKLLAETIRGTQQDPETGLRARLLRSIRDEADRRYRLAVPIAQAGLDEGHAKRRARIEAYLDERIRASKAKTKAEQQAVKDRLLRQAEKEAAATLLNRLVLLRQLEAQGLSKPAIVTGGWNSKGYKEFREFAPGVTSDETEGFAALLGLVFDELAVDLPGVFGDVGLTRLFPIPASMLRDVVERLDDPDLASAWKDDTTFGWIYQYWNDPDREALDAKINDGGKIEPHEIASKTQMFTERYMVEWLLQNSLGLTWLCMCKKHGWTADAERILPVLDARRAAFRAKREAGEVALDVLMPIDGELEDQWKYYVPQPLPDDAVASAPDSVRALKVLDPACGSGHFLVIAFDLLAALYREEARHRDEPITDEAIAEAILANNLYGIDIDPRAIQIAAAGLYLKAKSVARRARILRVNLVAPTLQLGNLPTNDPAVMQLRRDLTNEAGIPEDLTNKLLASLTGVDHLGSLLKVDAAVDEAIKGVELEFEKAKPGQGNLFTGSFPAQQVKLSVEAAKTTILDKLEGFLAQHSKSEDLGLRLDGEQLAAGVRFVRMAKEGTYDVVVGNPPYQGLSKTTSFEYVAKNYPMGKADLYAAFLERGLRLVRRGGVSAMVTMQGWMFLGQFSELRAWMVHENSIRGLADLMWCAFEQMRHATVAMAAVMRGTSVNDLAVAVAPTSRTEREESIPALQKKRAALLAQLGRFQFDARGFDVIEGEPIVYWWSAEQLHEYAITPKLGAASPARATQGLYNNVRFTRCWHEVRAGSIARAERPTSRVPWAPFTNGSNGLVWREPLRLVARWGEHGVEPKMYVSTRIKSDIFKFANERFFFGRPGVAFSMIGARFSARVSAHRGVFGDMGRSIFANDPVQVLCLLNSTKSQQIMASLNPSVHFTVGDVNRIPVFNVPDAEVIDAVVEEAFQTHESHRENSISFERPGSSAWRSAQDWAQRAIDRDAGDPLPLYEPTLEEPAPESTISFALGVALGRFGQNAEGILDGDSASALPGGLLFLTSETGEEDLKHPGCDLLRKAWKKKSANACAGYSDLGDYLRRGYFTSLHRSMYENRPIYLPLSSPRKNFVAYISIHRWAADTLTVLLGDHLLPTRRTLDGEIEDLRAARGAGNNKGKAEKRFAEVQKLLEELNDFIAKVTEIAERGPPPIDDKTTKREVDARFVMDLDDGVMVNSAALWPLLEPQWKDPKKCSRTPRARRTTTGPTSRRGTSPHGCAPSA